MNSEVLHFIEMVGGVSPYALPRPVKKPFSLKLSTLDKALIVIGVIFLIVGLALLVKSAQTDRKKLIKELDKFFKAEKKKMEDMADEITNLKKENLFTKNLLAVKPEKAEKVAEVAVAEVAEQVHEINGVKIEDIG